MPQISIDNQNLTTPDGTLVVEAAKKVGIEIPVFCYHPKLAPVGMCRMCLVEVGTPRRNNDGQIQLDSNGNPDIAWMPKLQTACTMVVSEGMSVRTASAQVSAARRAVLEFFLTSHPLDCPVCDKGGECPLQNLTIAYGPGQSRFPVEAKFQNDKRVPLGELVMLDRERCIQCARCIRFQDEIADDHVLGFATRGRGMEIVSLSQPPFDSRFSGNTIDLCPVGALTSRDFRLTARVWEVNDNPSVCAHCSVGCNLWISERDNEIKRIVPRSNEAVNEIWLCDKGRFAHHFAFAPDRLTTPLIRQNGKLVPSSWDEALDLVVEKLRVARKRHGAKAVAGLCGDRVPNEDLYLFAKLFRDVLGSNNIDHRVGWSAANAGASLVRTYGAGVGTNLGALNQDVAVLVLGADIEEEQPVLRLRLMKSARQHGAKIVAANGRLTRLNGYASQSLVYNFGSEAYFVLGIVRAILDQKLESKKFVAERVRGLAAFKRSIKPFTVTRCAKECGVAPSKIRAAARTFARSPDGLILLGRDMMWAMQQDKAVESALTALLLVSGHLGRINNGVIALYPHNNSMGAMDLDVLSEKKAKPRALYAVACDPAQDSKFIKPDFFVLQELFLTKTAQLADVVLPAQSFAERDGTFTNTERRVQLFRPALKPRGSAEPDWWIVSEIARRMGAQWSYLDTAQIMEEISAKVPHYRGMTHAALAKNIEKPRAPYWLGNPSDEPTKIAMGIVDDVSSGIQWMSLAERDPRMRFSLRWRKPRAPKRRKTRQMTLAVARSLYDGGTLMSKSKILQPRVPTPTVELNSRDAKALDVREGARVRLSFDRRIVEASARVNGRVEAGTVLIANNLDEMGALPLRAQVQVQRA